MLRRYSREEFYEHWLLNYLIVPGDRLYLASPCAFPPDSQVLRDWLEHMESWVVRGGRRSYEGSFQALSGAIRMRGLEGAIANVGVASPIPPQEGLRPLQALSAGRYNRDAVFSAMAVNNFWQSSKLKTQSEAERATHLRPETGSIWDEILKTALPPERRLRTKSAPRAACFIDSGAVFSRETACPRELATVVHTKTLGGGVALGGGGVVLGGGGVVPGGGARATPTSRTTRSVGTACVRSCGTRRPLYTVYYHVAHALQCNL